nr:hypothetical protein [Tanacetum cinerariifolium]
MSSGNMCHRGTNYLTEKYVGHIVSLGIVAWEGIPVEHFPTNIPQRQVARESGGCGDDDESADDQDDEDEDGDGDRLSLGKVSLSSIPQQQVTRERYPQRQVAGESPKMSLENVVNVSRVVPVGVAGAGTMRRVPTIRTTRMRMAMAMAIVSCVIYGAFPGDMCHRDTNYLSEKYVGPTVSLGIVAGEGIPVEHSPVNIPQRQVAKERYSQRRR